MNNHRNRNVIPLTRPRSEATGSDAGTAESLSVVLDGWNVLLGAADGFGYSCRQLSTFEIDLPRLVDRVAARRKRASRVERIGIVFGTHPPGVNPVAAAMQAAAIRRWRRDGRVIVLDPGMVAEGAGPEGGPIRYREASGDATIQRLLVDWTDDGVTDAAVLVSADADHLATVMDIRRRRRTHLEVARWEWQRSSLWYPGLWVHYLGVDVLDATTRDLDPRKAA
ncbi:hypothetical protein [Dietzia sp. 179-F 9C3 NHS]|uniref:hypothetical protein n=1 Tax=Dietzia sp. 179-F 9C3 NHS TaxID=3374295 RepID=UPI00387A135A